MEDTYIPMNNLIAEKTSDWTYTHLDMEYSEIAKRGIVLWCMENIKGKWTMLGGNKFGFSDAGDATVFRIHFGI